jgi:ADP-ribosylglycohydrolase
VGALAGAEHGVLAIPDAWITTLEERGRLFELARELTRLEITVR